MAVREGHLVKNADRRWREFDDSDQCQFASHRRFNDRVIDRLSSIANRQFPEHVAHNNCVLLHAP